MPLAIEIAAAQTPYRTLHEIAKELERGFVHRDPTQLEPRHETMTTTIRWSHDLLDDDAAEALVQLGVFVAPFEQNDAEAVIGRVDASRVLDTLVRHSLLKRSEHADRSTYHLPVPVQQYCAAELVRTGAETEILIAVAEWLLRYTDREFGDVWWRFSVIDEINPRFPHALTAIAALQSVGRADDAIRLASRLGGAARMFGRSDEVIALLTDPWPECADAESVADALVTVAQCADAVHGRRVVNQAVKRLHHLNALDDTVARQHQVFVQCEYTLWAIWAALLGDADFEPANEELRRARSIAAALDSPINHAQLEMWQSAVHLLTGDWNEAEVAALRSTENSVDTTFNHFATSCLAHARLQLGHPVAAVDLATRHPQRNRDNPHGDLLGIVAAIAQVRDGNTDDGLADIARIQNRARQTPFTIQQDDAAIAIAYIAHLMGHDDLTSKILETGVLGYGPWVGYLVTTMCRDLGIPLRGHLSRSVAESRDRSNRYGATAGRVLRELEQR